MTVKFNKMFKHRCRIQVAETSNLALNGKVRYKKFSRLRVIVRK